MSHDQVLDRLTEVFRLVFEDEELTLTRATSAEDIGAWDSMSNITLTIEVEHCFGIKIKSAEMEALKNVGDLIDLIRRHMAPATP